MGEDCIDIDHVSKPPSTLTNTTPSKECETFNDINQITFNTVTVTIPAAGNKEYSFSAAEKQMDLTTTNITTTTDKTQGNSNF